MVVLAEGGEFGFVDWDPGLRALCEAAFVCEVPAYFWGRDL